jgi:pimeloyl-ACP methyl ester carboxylesterase
MPKVDLAGVELDYVEQGSGTPLVLVHGSINDWRTWGQQLDAFAGQFRVIAYTRRHHHGSEDASSGKALSAATAARDLIALLESLSLGSAHVAGSSYGAFASLLAASERPDLVRTLVLGEPPVAHLLVSDPAVKQLWDEFMSKAYDPARVTIRGGDPLKGVRLFVDGVIGQGAYDMLPAPVQAIILDNAEALGRETEPSEIFGAKEAARVTMPVLLVTGEHSPPMFGAITDRLEALLPHAERIQIPQASHGMHGQNAAAYNAAVLDFLSRA